jgi:hypothetical protein
MNKLPPRERAAIIKRVKEINVRIRDPKLTIEAVDKLHKEREPLERQLRDDRSWN